MLDRRLLIFAACIVLFFLSSAAMLPIAATQVTKDHPKLADVIIAATILLPQAVVALHLALDRPDLGTVGPAADAAAGLGSSAAAGPAVCNADPSPVALTSAKR